MQTDRENTYGTIRIPNGILMPEVERLLKSGVNVTLKAKGNSMLPFIRPDTDSVELEYGETPSRFDTVLAKTDNGHYVMHRIIEINGNTATLMGDGNLNTTETCRLGNICGKVTAICRNGKRIRTGRRKYRLAAAAWHTALPVRRILLAILRRVPGHGTNH